MSCMKCGKEVSEDQVFCPECLAEMDRYPVKPGTPVLLPHREPIAAQRKRRPLKRVRKPEEQLAALRAADTLRSEGVWTEVYPDICKMKKQMEYANRRAIPYVVIIGSNELVERRATVKNMRTGEQLSVEFDAIGEHLI